MRILEFSIDGLAGRADTVAHALRPGVNIFFGANGRGKTSLLRILNAALQDDLGTLKRVPFLSASVTFCPDGHRTPVTRSISAAQVEAAPPLPPHTVMTANGPLLLPVGGPLHGWASTAYPGETFPTSYLTTARLFGDSGIQFWVGGPDNNPYSETRLDQQFLQLVINKWVNYLNPELTRIRVLQDESIAAILTSLFAPARRSAKASESSSGDAYDLVRQFFGRRKLQLKVTRQRFESQYAEDENLRQVVADIQDAETKIVEVERPRNELAALVARFVKDKKIVFSEGGIQVDVPSGTIQLDALSSGEKHLIRVLIECLAAQGDCLLIDEPELSLHVDWQRKLVDAMRTVNPALQMIMATHSPEIMADVHDECIIAL